MSAFGPMSVQEFKRRQAFDVMVQCARSKQRCPTNDVLGQYVVAELAHAGYIKVFVYGKNWRTVEIVRGPFAGARTAPPPRNYVCYKILDLCGTRRPTAEDLAA